MVSVCVLLAAVLCMVRTVTSDPHSPVTVTCSHDTHYVTRTAEPVTKTVFHGPHETISTTVYQAQYQTLYVPHYVTKTVVHPVTQTQTEKVTLVQTGHQTHYGYTATKYVPSYVTQVQSETTTTRTLTQYVGRKRSHCSNHQYATVTHTQWIPHYHTVTSTKEITRTACPKPTYG